MKRGTLWSRRGASYGLFGLAFLVTLWLALLSARKDPAPLSEAAVLVVLAGVFQLSGVFLRESARQAHPSLVRSARRRLTRIAVRAAAAEGLAQGAFESGAAPAVKHALGRVSVELSFIEEQVLDALDDWGEVLADVAGADQEDDSGTN